MDSDNKNNEWHYKNLRWNLPEVCNSMIVNTAWFCWGCFTSIMDEVGIQIISVRERLTSWARFWGERGSIPPNTGIRAWFINKSPAQQPRRYKFMWREDGFSLLQPLCVKGRLVWSLVRLDVWKEMRLVFHKARCVRGKLVEVVPY